MSTRSNLYVYNKDMLTHVSGLGFKSYPSMIVESNQDNANFEWFVSGKGNTSVGIGIVSKNTGVAGAPVSDLDVQFIVSANSNDLDLITLESSLGESIFSVNSNGGVGIGKDNVSTSLNVNGILKSTGLVVENLITDQLIFSDGEQWYFDYVNPLYI